MTKNAILVLERQARPVRARLHTGSFLHLSSIENAKPGLARYLNYPPSILYSISSTSHYNPRLTPFFTAVYIIEQIVLQTIYVVYKEILQFLDLKSEVYNQEQFQIKSRL